MRAGTRAALALAGLTGTVSASAALDCPVPKGAAARQDWTGRYEAGEGTPGGESGPPMVMTYRVDVFRDPDGRWRAFAWISGQTTFRELSACGTAGPRSLALTGVNARPAPDDEPEEAQPLLTLVRSARGAFAMRVEGGSYLLGDASIPAVRHPVPPWAGVYTAESCEEPGGMCWRYRIEVDLRDDGWRAQLAVDGPGVSERALGRGEDGDLAGGRSILDVAFVAPAAGDARRGEPRRRDEALARLARARDGTLTLELTGLPGPPGVRQAPMMRVTPVTSASPEPGRK